MIEPRGPLPSHTIYLQQIVTNSSLEGPAPTTTTTTIAVPGQMVLPWVAEQPPGVGCLRAKNQQ